MGSPGPGTSCERAPADCGQEGDLAVLFDKHVVHCTEASTMRMSRRSHARKFDKLG